MYAPFAPIVNVPTPVIVAVWPALIVELPHSNCVTLSGSPSTSVSLLSTLPVATVSSLVVTVSDTPTGASFTDVIAIASVDVVLSEPSLNVYVALGTTPW